MTWIIGGLGAAVVVAGVCVLLVWLDWSADVAKLHGIIERQRIENGRLRKQLAQYQGEQSGI